MGDLETMTIICVPADAPNRVAGSTTDTCTRCQQEVSVALTSLEMARGRITFFLCISCARPEIDAMLAGKQEIEPPTEEQLLEILANLPNKEHSA